MDQEQRSEVAAKTDMHLASAVMPKTFHGFAASRFVRQRVIGLR